MTNDDHYLEQAQERIEHALNRYLPSHQQEPKELHRAMRYAALNNSGHICAALTYAVGETLGADPELLDRCACAVEMMQAASLIHDDLPALDNGNIHRRQPACHVAFGEASAILAGDALLGLALELLTDENEHVSAKQQLMMTKVLAHTMGSFGMTGGEALDLKLLSNKPQVEDLQYIYHLKISLLLGASLKLAALASRCDDADVLAHLQQFAD